MGRTLNGGGGGLTISQGATLEHIEYDPIADKVVTDRGLVTTLNSLYLGGQLELSSGGDDLIVTNMAQEIDHYLAYGGIKDQSVLANQDGTGLIQPQIKVFADELESMEPSGIADASGVVGCSSSIVNPFSKATFAVEFITEEAIIFTDHIHYSVYAGTDDTGIQIYDQEIDGMVHAVGDRVKLNLGRPVILQAGEVIYAKITKSNTVDSEHIILNVRRSLTEPSSFYVKVYFRTYISKPIATQSMIDKTIIGEDLEPSLKGSVERFGLLPTDAVQDDIYRCLKRNFTFFGRPAGYYQAVVSNPTVTIGAAGWRKVSSAGLPIYAIANDTDKYQQFTVDDIESLTTGASYWSKSGNDITYSEGNVGIGRPDPTAILEVVEDNAFAPSILKISGMNTPNAIGNYSGIGFAAGSLGNVSTTSISSIRTANYGQSDLVFLLKDAPSAWSEVALSDEKMRLASDGSLTVGGSLEATGPIISQDGYFYIGDPDTDGSGRISMDGVIMTFETRAGGVWNTVGGFS
jgi:hypothetical protein